MDHSVAIALEDVTVGMSGFGIGSAPTSLHWKPQSRQHAGLRRATAAGVGGHHLRDAGDGRLAVSDRREQLTCLGIVAADIMLCQGDGGLIPGNEDRRILHQVFQQFLALIEAGVGKIDLGERNLSEGGIVLAGMVGHVLKFFSASDSFPWSEWMHPR